MENTPLRKNDTVELLVTGTSHDGMGVGRAGGMAVFLPACAPGDRVRALIVGVRKNMAYAKSLEILSASPARVEPDCAAFPRCGGCAFRHIDYKEELRIKQGRVADAFRRIAHMEVPIRPIVGAEETEGYRNKAEYPVASGEQGMQVGFFARGSHRIVDSEACRACRLQPPSFRAAVGAFEKWAMEYGVPAYDEQTGDGLLRHIYLRSAPGSGAVMACAVVNSTEIPGEKALVSRLREAVPELTSVVLNINQAHNNVILGPVCRTLWGADRISGTFCGLKIEISPLSFYQVNSRQAERLYAAAKELACLRGDGLLLDLYCGAGIIGLSMAQSSGQVIGVEIVPEACADARRNAALNGIENTEFLCADAQEAAEELTARGLKPDVVVLDPPRRGCSAGTVEAVVRMEPARVVYVSCDPETLARDAALFASLGYACKEVRPFDLFPRTSHVECVVLMTNCRSDG